MLASVGKNPAGRGKPSVRGEKSCGTWETQRPRGKILRGVGNPASVEKFQGLGENPPRPWDKSSARGKNPPTVGQSSVRGINPASAWKNPPPGDNPATAWKKSSARGTIQRFRTASPTALCCWSSQLGRGIDPDPATAWDKPSVRLTHPPPRDNSASA